MLPITKITAFTSMRILFITFFLKVKQEFKLIALASLLVH